MTTVLKTMESTGVFVYQSQLLDVDDNPASNGAAVVQMELMLPPV
jgi:hypothetical protein